MIFEKLKRLGIQARDKSGSQTVTCPQCSHLRRKKSLKCLSVKIDERSGIYFCHHCGWSGAVFADESGNGRMVHTGAGDKPSDSWRNLDAASGMAFFPELERKTSAVFFRYQEGWKARAYPEKAFVAGGGFKLSVLESASGNFGLIPDEIFIVEGQCHVMPQKPYPSRAHANGSERSKDKTCRRPEGTPRI